jgi:hypothetical protein
MEKITVAGLQMVYVTATINVLTWLIVVAILFRLAQTVSQHLQWFLLQARVINKTRKTEQVL